METAICPRLAVWPRPRRLVRFKDDDSGFFSSWLFVGIKSTWPEKNRPLSCSYFTSSAAAAAAAAVVIVVIQRGRGMVLRKASNVSRQQWPARPRPAQREGPTGLELIFNSFSRRRKNYSLHAMLTFLLNSAAAIGPRRSLWPTVTPIAIPIYVRTWLTVKDNYRVKIKF